MRIAMTKKLDTTLIQIIHPVCCGLDVHKKKYRHVLLQLTNRAMNNLR